jgi:hypothetical protein
MELGMVEHLDYKFDTQIFCTKSVLCVRSTSETGVMYCSGSQSADTDRIVTPTFSSISVLKTGNKFYCLLPLVNERLRKMERK